MSSEEMRIELESFVNKGLREGWTGWPVKVDSCVTNRLAGQWSVSPVRTRLGDCDSLIGPIGLQNAFYSLHSLC